MKIRFYQPTSGESLRVKDLPEGRFGRFPLSNSYFKRAGKTVTIFNPEAGFVLFNLASHSWVGQVFVEVMPKGSRIELEA